MKKKHFYKIGILSLAAIFILSINGCYKDNPVPENPYSKINYITPPLPVDTLNPASFVALHRNIFSAKCAMPGCHDGHFEPDFRTLQSTYSTLVYSPVTKNNVANSFVFRVKPHDKAKSVLYERITNCCFVNQDDRMPQSFIGGSLPQSDIDAIGNWISNGAKDMFGLTPAFPNKEPIIPFYIAINGYTPPIVIYSNTSNRIDSIYYNPFIMPPSTQFMVAVKIEDDSTGISQLQFNKLRTSYDPDNFSTSAPGYKEYSSVYIASPTNPAEQYWVATVNTGHFNPDKVVYMRFYTKDGNHSNITEFPVNSSILPYKTFWSFYITP